MGSLSNKGFPTVNLNIEDPDFNYRLATIVNNILNGKLNNTGSVRLVHGGTSTTVSDAKCGPDTVVHLMATSADGAVALDQWRISTITNGAFTITHVSTSTSTCTAKYSLLG